MVNRWSANWASLGAVASRHYEGMESLAAFAPPPAPHIRRTTNDNGPCVTSLNAGASTTSVGGRVKGPLPPFHTRRKSAIFAPIVRLNPAARRTVGSSRGPTAAPQMQSPIERMVRLDWNVFPPPSPACPAPAARGLPRHIGLAHQAFADQKGRHSHMLEPARSSGVKRPLSPTTDASCGTRGASASAGRERRSKYGDCGC